jgi:hypothetical protein
MNKLAVTVLVTTASWCASLTAMAQEPVKLWEEAYIRVRTGVTIRAVLHASIEAGHYVVAADPNTSKHTPLALKMEPTEGVTLGAPEYPKGQLARLEQTARDLPAYDGLLEIGLPLQVSAEVKWESKQLRGTLVYQSCDGRKCLPPASLPVELNIEVRSSREQSKP